MTQRERELEARLATAMGLLRMHATYPLHPDVSAFLASATPAAPGRTEAEQAVLDACARAEFIRYDGRECICDEDFAIGDAELALREASK